jgi:hypothetical protein
LRARRGIVAAVAAVATLGVGACGGQSEEIEEVRGAVEEILGSDDPERCARFSQEALEQITGERGERAVRTCEQVTEEGEPPEQVTAARIEVDGDTATSNYNDGTTAGQLELEQQDGEWIITSLTLGIDGAAQAPAGEGGGAPEGEGAEEPAGEGAGEGSGG